MVPPQSSHLLYTDVLVPRPYSQYVDRPLEAATSGPACGLAVNNTSTTANPDAGLQFGPLCKRAGLSKISSSTQHCLELSPLARYPWSYCDGNISHPDNSAATTEPPLLATRHLIH